MLEFNRPVGNGLTQEEASNACKKHGFTTQTVGTWARGGWVVNNKSDGLRYLTHDGREWIKDNERSVPAVWPAD